MYTKDIMNDIYNDFFGSKYDIKNEDFNVEENSEETIEEISIDSLYISDESKELLKKIITYMEKYNLKEESNFIGFNIIINDNNIDLKNKILNILNTYSKKYNYLKDSINNISFYDFDDLNKLDKAYDNSLVSITDLSMLNMNDLNFKMKFFHNFKEKINSDSITVINDKKDNIKEFLQNDSELERYFIFNINSIKPSSNDIYNDISKKLNLSDELSIKLLDYISNTFDKTTLNYYEYMEDLIRYINFNKDVPALEETKDIDEVFKSLNELIGLKKVKKTLTDLVDLISLKKKTGNELSLNSVNLHMVFLGNPGTGKSTVARMVSNILYDLKYIKQDKLIEVSSKDLVAEYVGQTAVKTMNVINKALGGVLFIDEAYALADKNNQNSYNAEAIATLIKAMEDYRDELVVIFAGYSKEMQDFLDSNSGIVSRIGYTLEFDDYTNEELIEIFKSFVSKAGFILEDDALDEVDRIINENRDTKNFGNARFVRNMFERTVINHATNTKNIKNKTKLKTITKKDIKY